MPVPSASRSARSIPWLVVAGVLVAALSLRGPIVAPTPVLRDIARDLDIGAATAGLLISAPVLMFAALTPVAAVVIRRVGAELALLVSLVGVLAGTFVRALPGFSWMLVGMLLIGASITIGNVVIPVIIRRDVPPQRVATMTAAYAAMLNAGSLVTILITAPLAAGVGWPLALLAWSGVTSAGVVLWSVRVWRTRRTGMSSADRFSGEEATSAAGSTGVDPATITGPLPVLMHGGREKSILRRPVTWLLMAAFGGQTTIYYALSAWLPTFADDVLGLDRSAAGALASLYQGAGILGAFLVPLLARFTPRLVPALTICASWLILGVGILVAPELLWLWLVVGAIGHAGGFVVIFSALVGVARSDAEAAGMSALVQGFGYAVGALGAPVMGALHDVSGGWMLPLSAVLVLAVLYCGVLLTALAASHRARR